MAKKVQQQPPKIEFPCAYSIRIMGEAETGFVDKVFDITRQFAPEVQRHKVKPGLAVKATLFRCILLFRQQVNNNYLVFTQR